MNIVTSQRFHDLVVQIIYYKITMVLIFDIKGILREMVTFVPQMVI